jgi:meiotic recombination protein REC8, fungi type
VRASTRKVGKKAILDVNVPKACDTIVHPPGAPIALRLQGNLLYGVSRVYDEQCGYMLTDVESVRRQLRTFVNVTGNLNALDPKAGKAK